ncbi:MULTISPECIES: Rieske (2Fe-2S) protein [Methanobacterium]|uniref:Rieske 2Fe-2S domain-containing protein n=1 Tax=Methanobacterium veterum TaxID=408577 RepID=A0A9E4ZXV0_9EURY|nr:MULTISPECIES: Rieske 2Fe-2S domain-containing protein [Methanobacterium]MCZ3365572.1 Rieske 2Fe-2S domain-containing protein [Methanobacterium veterum]MCZ3371035.1 Rieske 2Fe-2S domain-containing protein [Methanobacterium veterum]
MSFVEVARIDEVPEGSMKHVEEGDAEILLAKVDGKIYAVGDRCGHMNARLSMGKLQGTTVICPLHASQFDVTTGKNVKEPVLTSIPGAEKVPELKKYSERLEKIIAPVKTYDLPTFNVKVEGETILVNIK